MKLIIDIPEERYKDIQRIASVQLKKRTDTVEQIIANGIPLEDFIKNRKEPIDKDVLKSYLKERTMPNSLKCRLKKLAYQGLLSEKDLSRIYTDNDVVEELEKIKSEYEEIANNLPYRQDYYNDGRIDGLETAMNIMDKHISELKGE